MKKTFKMGDRVKVYGTVIDTGAYHHPMMIRTSDGANEEYSIEHVHHVKPSRIKEIFKACGANTFEQALENAAICGRAIYERRQLLDALESKDVTEAIEAIKNIGDDNARLALKVKTLHETLEQREKEIVRLKEETNALSSERDALQSKAQSAAIAKASSSFFKLGSHSCKGVEYEYSNDGLHWVTATYLMFNPSLFMYCRMKAQQQTPALDSDRSAELDKLVAGGLVRKKKSMWRALCQDDASKRYYSPLYYYESKEQARANHAGQFIKLLPSTKIRVDV